MLQKPTSRSKAKVNCKYLAERLEKWKSCDINSLMKEAREIRKRVTKEVAMKTTSRNRRCCQLMLHGKVSKAMALINQEDKINGVHELTESVLSTLKAKHPKSKPAPSEAVLPEIDTDVQPVIYEGIDATAIQKAKKILMDLEDRRRSMETYIMLQSIW